MMIIHSTLGKIVHFDPSPFDIDGLHLQFTKAKLFSDEVVAGKILAANHPREQKSLGLEVAGFNWDTCQSFERNEGRDRLILELQKDYNPEYFLQ